MEIQSKSFLKKNPELLKEILEEDKKREKRIPNVCICKNSLEKRKKE